MPIEAGSDFLLSQLDSAYHKECFEEWIIIYDNLHLVMYCKDGFVLSIIWSHSTADKIILKPNNIFFDEHKPSEWANHALSSTWVHFSACRNEIDKKTISLPLEFSFLPVELLSK